MVLGFFLISTFLKTLIMGELVALFQASPAELFDAFLIRSLLVIQTKAGRAVPAVFFLLNQ